MSVLFSTFKPTKIKTPAPSILTIICTITIRPLSKKNLPKMMEKRHNRLSKKTRNFQRINNCRQKYMN